jgi:hypothetical protein
LWVTVTFVSETVPPLSRSPPPCVARPPVIVRLLMLTVVPASMVKMRNAGVPAALLRATVSFLAPGPSMVTSALRSGRAVASWIVPVTLKSMVLPALLSACVIT